MLPAGFPQTSSQAIHRNLIVEQDAKADGTKQVMLMRVHGSQRQGLQCLGSGWEDFSAGLVNGTVSKL